MTAPAVPPDRRAAHFLSLLPWTARDLDPVLAGVETFPVGRLQGREVAFFSDAAAAELTREPVWQAVVRAGATPHLLPFSRGAAPAETGAETAAVWVAEPPRASDLIPFARRAPRPLLCLRSERNDPLRALTDFACLRRILATDAPRVHWRGPSTPRLAGWVELATKYPVELDVVLEGPGTLDPALLEFARVRRKAEFHLPARAAAAGRARVLLWRDDPGAAAPPHAVWVPAMGSAPWPTVWDEALAGSLLEELLRRWEVGESSGGVEVS